MITDRKLLEMIAAKVGKMDQDVEEIKIGQKRLENTVTRIDQDHGKKLEALFVGYMQNNDRLDRIEKVVANQEEVNIKRVK